MYLARKELADVLFSISLKNGELQRYEHASAVAERTCSG
jgi:hypothetical protein